ncbi:MAG: LysR family transcriptional regulator [Rhodospirillales bacterium]|nr:LysR family transcriptional regulator [Rhodospirillales bacterium]
MTLEQLRIFVAVAERQHVTEAARALNLAQSAASHAIAVLEAQFDTRLFARIGRRIALTEAGTAFLAEARAVLAQAARAERVLGAFGRLDRGSLALYASQTIAGYWLPRHLAAFRHAHPGITLQLGIGNTATVAAAVAGGEAELGFVEGQVDDPAIEGRVVARDRLVVVVAPDHPWATEPPESLAAALRTDWVMREPGSGTRSVFEAHLAQAGLDPAALPVAMTLPSNEAVRAAAEAGLGAAALSASVAAATLEAGLLHRVPLPMPERAFHVVSHRTRYRSRAAEALLAALPQATRSPALASFL